jgi:hypothetical protein
VRNKKQKTYTSNDGVLGYFSSYSTFRRNLLPPFSGCLNLGVTYVPTRHKNPEDHRISNTHSENLRTYKVLFNAKLIIADLPSSPAFDSQSRFNAVLSIAERAVSSVTTQQYSYKRVCSFCDRVPLWAVHLVFSITGYSGPLSYSKCSTKHARKDYNDLNQWYSTWGTRTPGGTRRHLRGYVKLKKLYYFMMNTE